ncbi:glycoside hydrolase family 3 protein [Massilia sp. WG5]|uniref:glycoside hydrolase family 3 protein n=1 Tax=Massilia sp. WG5 TaxID=1707785 RepID=UPI0009E74A69|nr:glycoside hydrolase family 3 N-terminal domain-containing protein [Massilia sp. WG5]
MHYPLFRPLAAGAAACALLAGCAMRAPAPAQPQLSTRTVPLIEVDGLRFRDLNRNGKLDAYEDWRLPARVRAASLVAAMRLEEKAGLMMHGNLAMRADGSQPDLAAMRPLLLERHVSTFVSRQQGDAGQLAAVHNRLQELAEQSRFAIPVSLSTDPRNHFQYTVGQTVAGGGFSQWPEPLGLAAIGDPALTRRFADIVRQEYLATGFTQSLSPQADLATEPRWPRVFSTFGEDAASARRQVQAWVEGLQDGDRGLHPGSVVAVVKHWAGYGAAKDGWDSHNPWGRFMSFPGPNSADHFAYHLLPFDGAFAAKVASVMPTYSEPDGRVELDGVVLDPVGGGYSHALLTELLRGKKGFDGVVLSDWAITNDCAGPCLHGAPEGVTPLAFFPQFGTPWGVEQLGKRARFVKGVNAGLDQFGGTEEASYLVEAVRAGELPVARIDASATRILLQKFQQGLFENPYVDEARALATVGKPAFRAEGLEAQRRSLVLLQNKGGLLPLTAAGTNAGRKVWLHGVDAAVAARYGFTPVADPAQAELAIVRAATPFEVLHPRHIFGLLAHEGSLAFVDGNPDYEAIKRASSHVPTIVTVNLERAAILTNVVDKAGAVLANFGVSDEALFDVLTGKARPEGRLPVELPSSMAAAARQRPDLPHDSENPLFPFGFGLSY